MLNESNFNAAHLTTLRDESGLSDEVIVSRGYCTVISDKHLKEMGFGKSQQNAPGLLVPLHHPNGTNGNYIYKPDNPRYDKDGRVMKYESRFNDRLQLDVNPLPWVLDGVRNPNLPLIVTEGAKKVDAAATHGLVGINLTGVYAYRGTNEYGAKTTLVDWRFVGLGGRETLIVYDSDVMDNLKVAHALRELSEILKTFNANVKFVYLPRGPHGEKTGLDDFFVRGGTAEGLFSLATSERRDVVGEGAADLQGIEDSTIARRLHEMKFENRFAYDEHRRCWLEYGAEVPGAWRRISPLTFERHLMDELVTAFNRGVNQNKVASVERTMRTYAVRVFETPPRHLLPTRNGIVDLNTGECLDHDPNYGFTWGLPYDYDLTATCPKFEAWVEEVFATTGDPQGWKEVLQAFARAVITGRADLQVFLELVGPAASGKSSFISVMRALTGWDKTISTSLPLLETNRFESASLHGKWLVEVSEADAYAGAVNRFKALTGQDLTRNEWKNMNRTDETPDFVFSGMVITAGNQPMRCLDQTSGFPRRRLTVEFPKASNQSRRLMGFNGTTPTGEFATELPGILNWALSLPVNQMEYRLQPYGRGLPGKQGLRLQTLVDSSSVAGWADECLVYDVFASTQVGKVKPDEMMNRRYENEHLHLYPSYVAWCEGTRQKPAAHNQFSNALLWLAHDQLDYQVEKDDTQKRSTFIKGVRLRTKIDEHLPRFVSDAGMFVQ